MTGLFSYETPQHGFSWFDEEHSLSAGSYQYQKWEQSHNPQHEVLPVSAGTFKSSSFGTMDGMEQHQQQKASTIIDFSWGKRRRLRGHSHSQPDSSSDAHVENSGVGTPIEYQADGQRMTQRQQHHQQKQEQPTHDGSGGLPPPQPQIYVSYGCLLIPVFMAAWWYYMKNACRKAFSKEIFIRATTEPTEGGEDTDNPERFYAKFPRFNNAYMNWDESDVGCGSDANSSDTSNRFVKWINRGNVHRRFQKHGLEVRTRQVLYGNETSSGHGTSTNSVSSDYKGGDDNDNHSTSTFSIFQFDSFPIKTAATTTTTTPTTTASLSTTNNSLNSPTFSSISSPGKSPTTNPPADITINLRNGNVKESCRSRSSCSSNDYQPEPQWECLESAFPISSPRWEWFANLGSTIELCSVVSGRGTNTNDDTNFNVGDGDDTRTRTATRINQQGSGNILHHDDGISTNGSKDDNPGEKSNDNMTRRQHDSNISRGDEEGEYSRKNQSIINNNRSDDETNTNKNHVSTNRIRSNHGTERYVYDISTSRSILDDTEISPIDEEDISSTQSASTNNSSRHHPHDNKDKITSLPSQQKQYLHQHEQRLQQIMTEAAYEQQGRIIGTATVATGVMS